MKIHYMNCATMYPRLAGIFVRQLASVPSLCLLLEAGEQLVLVDAGFGTRDMEEPGRLGRANFLLNAWLDTEQTAIRQIERLGLRPQEVRHIICTHLDRDHAGGLSDFPHATVHVLRAEYEAATSPRTPKERNRYRRCHFAHGPNWEMHEAISEKAWFGMDCIGEVPGLGPDIVLVPLTGHTRGHCGVAMNTGDGWLLHCGDAYYVKDEVEEGRRNSLGVSAFRRLAHCHYSEALLQIERLRRAKKGSDGQIRLLASHDASEYETLFGENLSRKRHQ